MPTNKLICISQSSLASKPRKYPSSPQTSIISRLFRINHLQNKVKYQENIIDELQKEIKYLNGIKNQQEKELKIYENEDVKHNLTELEKEVNSLKDRLKVLKKNAQKREEADKRQQAYQIQLEKELRKLNDEYYPGKVEKKEEKDKDKDKEKEEEYHDISEREWQTVKIQLAELKKLHQENGKKIELIVRQKNRELKSSEENDLKLKERHRKLNTLKSKL